MLIAYIFHLIDGPESGVFKKIMDQSHQWINHGNKVAFFILTQTGLAKSFIDRAAGIPTFVYEYEGIAKRSRRLSQLFASVVDYLPSIVYYRYDLYHPAFRHLSKKIPVFVEINSDDIAEFRMGNRFRRWYNYLTRRYIFLNSKGLILESHQLAKLPHLARFGKPYIAIGNGIDLKRFRQLDAPRNFDPILIFMGSPNQPWHGIDKILWLAHRLKTWRFDLIGPDPADFRGSPRNVFFHGFLNQSQYELLLAQADVAIGPLSLYLIGKKESSPLKVREYLAYGLPTIVGYQDMDFPEGAPFLLQIGNDPDNIINNFSRIEKFVSMWRGKRVPRNDIRCLDVSIKEEKKLAFLNRFMNAQE